MTTKIPHILVVDDHPDILDSLAKYLTKNEFRVTKAKDGQALRKCLLKAAIDLVVLDVMMPGEDGLSLCRYLRETQDIPVILLTARADDMDRIIGLEIGADDYVTKPFNPRELLARIKSVLRRGSRIPPVTEQLSAKCLRFDRWIFDIRRRELIDDQDVAIALSAAEFAILAALAERPCMILSRHQLLDLTQGRDAVLFDRSIDNHVSRLRRKLERDPKSPELIKTVWGRGYIFTAQVEHLCPPADLQ